MRFALYIFIKLPKTRNTEQRDGIVNAAYAEMLFGEGDGVRKQRNKME